MTIDEIPPNQIVLPSDPESNDIKRRPSFLLIIISVVLILSMLTLIIYPILHATGNGGLAPTSTPTPYIWQLAANGSIK